MSRTPLGAARRDSCVTSIDHGPCVARSRQHHTCSQSILWHGGAGMSDLRRRPCKRVGGVQPTTAAETQLTAAPPHLSHSSAPSSAALTVRSRGQSLLR
jgi:hypothetical protein